MVGEKVEAEQDGRNIGRQKEVDEVREWMIVIRDQRVRWGN